MADLRTAPILGKIPDIGKITDQATKEALEQIIRFMYDNQSNIHDDLNDLNNTAPALVKATQAQAEAATDDAAYMTALQVKNEVQKSGAVSIPAANITGLTAIPSGVIAMWSGTIATIPSGWLLCNGSNGTPDLRDRFIVGAKQDDSGIAKTNVTGVLTQSGDGQIPSHSHDGSTLSTDTTGSHTHTFSQAIPGSGVSRSVVDAGFVTNSSETGTTNAAGSHSHTISGNTGASGTGTKNIATYYALAFIMKS